MGHYDECREGYCSVCGQSNGNCSHTDGSQSRQTGKGKDWPFTPISTRRRKELKRASDGYQKYREKKGFKSTSVKIVQGEEEMDLDNFTADKARKMKIDTIEEKLKEILSAIYRIAKVEDQLHIYERLDAAILKELEKRGFGVYSHSSGRDEGLYHTIGW